MTEETNMTRALPRPSPAVAISLIALFISLGGTGYAAIRITGKNVANSSLTGKDVKRNSLTGSDVKSLTARDFARGTLRAGARGPQGPPGPAGPSGASEPPTEAGSAVAAAPSAAGFHCSDPQFVARFCGRLGSQQSYGFWRNAASGYEAAGFFKDRSGIVHLQGSVQSAGDGPAPTTIFVLPPGYRPRAGRVFGVYDASRPSGYVEIQAGGQVNQRSADATYPSALLQLDGISFRP